MHVRIITATEPSGRFLYEDRRPRDLFPRTTAPVPPWLGLAGSDDDPAETHIVRGID
ncbi:MULTISPECIES: hypothetical protein [unclassified Streptomyces]|uniref:hypothetical protein n=1 Tax=unclassified Streptomyces TaxID=2593676 RepID=UPI0033D26719